jgi:TetR/AcrR family transcriptional regulator, transcriptional repressor for nem operon
MDRTPSKREKTHQRMVDAAGRSFKSKGYAGIGVDGIAKAAGVTSGAFYAHFGSKDAAFVAALAHGLDEVIAGIPEFQREHGANWVSAFADYYLGKPHRADLSGGCAMTTLSPEVVRAQPGVRSAYEAKMTHIAALIASGLKSKSKTEALGRAWAMLGVLIGGLTIARAVENTKLATRIAHAIRNAAIEAAGETK